jgi:hypothetical protein
MTRAEFAFPPRPAGWQTIFQSPQVGAIPLILIFSYITFLIKPEYGFFGVGTTTWLALSRRQRNGGEGPGAMGCYPRLLNSMTSACERRSAKSHGIPTRMDRGLFDSRVIFSLLALSLSWAGAWRHTIDSIRLANHCLML